MTLTNARESSTPQWRYFVLLFGVLGIRKYIGVVGFKVWWRVHIPFTCCRSIDFYAFVLMCLSACLCPFLSVFLSVIMSLWVSFCCSMYLWVFVNISGCVSRCINLSLSTSFYLSRCVSVYLPLCRSVLSLCLSINHCVFLSITVFFCVSLTESFYAISLCLSVLSLCVFLFVCPSTFLRGSRGPEATGKLEEKQSEYGLRQICIEIW